MQSIESAREQAREQAETAAEMGKVPMSVWQEDIDAGEVSGIPFLGTYLPENVLTNSKLAEDFGRWEPEKIESKLGIKERHISNEKGVH